MVVNIWVRSNEHLINQNRESGNGAEEINLKDMKQLELIGLEDCYGVRIEGEEERSLQEASWVSGLGYSVGGVIY